MNTKPHFSSFNITSYFFYIDLISSLLGPRLINPESTLIHVGAYDSKLLKVFNSVCFWLSMQNSLLFQCAHIFLPVE